MSDAVLIQPTRQRLATAVPLEVLEIALGGTPRGLVVLLGDPAVPEVDLVEAMNAVAADGYELLAATVDASGTDAVLDRAAERGWEPEQIGVIGFGAGGALALDLARTRQLGAAVGFSPRVDVAAVAADPALRTAWLGMLGEDDDALSPDEVRTLRRALREGSDVFSQVVVYPGVGADFHRHAGTGVGFSASYDGWQRALEWLNARVAARLTPAAVAWRERQASA